jgi:hypothetical protein
MQMKLPGLVLTFAVALLVSASASAAPITTGVWGTAAPTGDPAVDALSVDPFWDGASDDCFHCGVGYLINAWADSRLEYLNNGFGGYTSFGYDGPMGTPNVLFNITGWPGGTFGRRADGAFTYDSHQNPAFNSFDSPEQFALFRIVGPELTLYFLAIEDRLWNDPLSDHDYNDFVTWFTAPTDPVPVPEPSTLLLLGSSVAALAARKRAAARKAQALAS